MEVIKDNFLVLLIDFLLLPQDNITLPRDCRGFKLGVLQEITDDVHSGRNVFTERLGIVKGLLARGVSIEMSAEVLDLKFESMLRTAVRSLESHMFQEVSSAIRCIGFCA